MILIFFTLILILIAIGFASVKSKGKVKIIFLSISITTILASIAFLALIKPAQKGQFLPAWGKISLLFAAPKDLWIPLAETALMPNKNEYSLKLTHKYVGNYGVKLVFANNINMRRANKNSLFLDISFFDENNKIFSRKTSNISSFKNSGGNGLICIRYSLPEDLPIGKELNIKIVATGDIGKFINKYGDTKIIIKKISDI